MHDIVIVASSKYYE